MTRAATTPPAMTPPMMMAGATIRRDVPSLWHSAVPWAAVLGGCLLGGAPGGPAAGIGPQRTFRAVVGNVSVVADALPGRAAPLGATPRDGGTNFALASG